MILSQGVYSVERQGLFYKTDIDLQLRLPNLEEKYKLVFSNYNESKERRSAYASTQQTKRENEDYGASLAFFKNIGNFKLRFRPRIQIKNPVETFYTLQVGHKILFGHHSFASKFQLFADSKKGTGQFASIRYRTPSFGSWGHSLLFEEEYQDAGNYFSFLQGYTIHYRISDSMILSQSFVLTSNNEPVAPNPKKTSFKSKGINICLLYTSPSPRDQRGSRMPSSA